MYDVEYLLNEPAFDRALVYRYRTGVLLREVRRRLEKILANEGSHLSSSEPGSFCSCLAGSTLFDNYIPLCDWPRRKPRGFRRHASSIIDQIGDLGATRGVLIAHFDDPIFKLPGWSRTEERCLVIEEPIVTAESVGAVVRYLLSISDIKPPPSDDASVIAHFQTLLAIEGEEEFGQFYQRFDETILLHCDRNTGVFKAPPLSAVDTLGRSYIMSPLRRLIQERRESSIDDLITGLEVRLRKRALTLRMTFRDLHDVSDRLIDIADKGGAGFDYNAVKERAVLWSCLLLIFNQRSMGLPSDLQEKLVPRADLALAEFDALARQFLARATGAQSLNPIGDLWPELRKVLKVFCRDEPSMTEEDEVPEDEDEPQYVTKIEGVAPVKLDAEKARPSPKKPKRRRADVRVSAQARTIKAIGNVLADRDAFSIWPIWIERLNSYLRPALARRLQLDEEEAA